MQKDNEENKRNNTLFQRVWNTIGFWVIIIAELLAFALVICIAITGVSALVHGEPFVEVFLGTLSNATAMFGGILIGILKVMALIAALLLIMFLMELSKDHTIIFLVVILVIIIAIPAGSNTYRKYSSSHTGTQHSQMGTSTDEMHEHWDRFEKMSRIGDEYSSIAGDYYPFSEEFVMNGGVFLKANNEIYYAFPRYDKAEIRDSDLCSGMAGTTKDLFGYTKSVTLADFTRDIGLTSRTELDGNLTFKKTSSGKYYYVTILSTDIVEDSDLVFPDTWISIVTRNIQITPIGKLASDQTATEETVFFVENGTRYHRDASCSSLHDSNEIYECYKTDLPEGRTPCDNCY